MLSVKEHKQKIDMADEIFVINVGGYIGSSTGSEIEYAIKTGKKVNYLENKEGNVNKYIGGDYGKSNIKMDLRV